MAVVDVWQSRGYDMPLWLDSQWLRNGPVLYWPEVQCCRAGSFLAVRTQICCGQWALVVLLWQCLIRLYSAPPHSEFYEQCPLFSWVIFLTTNAVSPGSLLHYPGFPKDHLYISLSCQPPKKISLLFFLSGGVIYPKEGQSWGL